MSQSLEENEKSNSLFHSKIKTPFGELICHASVHGISTLLFNNDEIFANNISNLNFSINRKNNHIIQLEEELIKYFKGKLTIFQTPVDTKGTDFQQKVWSELRQIQFGQTITYLQLATKLGDAKKVRAVANANARNKVLILIPCHRVIGNGNKLTGYRGGIDRKRLLINFESENIKAISKTTLF